MVKWVRLALEKDFQIYAPESNQGHSFNVLTVYLQNTYCVLSTKYALTSYVDWSELELWMQGTFYSASSSYYRIKNNIKTTRNDFYEMVRWVLVHVLVHSASGNITSLVENKQII